MPEPPLPVRGTDAVEGSSLARRRASNPRSDSASLLGLGNRLRGRDRAQRAEALRRSAHAWSLR